MKNLFLYLLLVIFSLNLNAGAPAPNTSLPEPPYIFKKGTLVSAEVNWNKDSLKKFLPNGIILDEIVNGGIDVFFTRHDKPLTRINYAILWINLNNNNKILVLGFIGPNYDSNRLIEKISEKNLTLAKSRLMLINEKFSFRTNINNKLSFNLSGTIKGECKNKNNSKKIEINKNKSFLITNKSDDVCGIENTNIEFAENYSGIKVNKILDVNLFKDAEVVFSY